MTDAPYIVFEGIDGTGKSTQARLLASWLGCHFDYVIRTKEPHLESTKEKASTFLDTDARAMVFEADRLAWENLPLNQIRSRAVVQDRSFYSTIAYQNPSEPVREFILRERPRQPDAVILLDAPAHALRARLEGRGALDEYEYDIEFQEAVRERYLEVRNLASVSYTIDALLPIGTIHEMVVDFAEEWFHLDELEWF